MTPQTEHTLPRWLWLWLPIVAYLAHYAALIGLDTSVYEAWCTGEAGITERATIVVLVIALVLGMVTTTRLCRQRRWLLATWFGLFTLGCLYFGGEEASWGQHWFGWVTPENWQALNNQDETNLHNSNALAGSLLDQLPRNLLAVAMLIGGGILPMVRRLRGIALAPDTFKYWLAPSVVCVPVGWIAPLASLPGKILDPVPQALAIQFGEVKELMMALFLLIYIAAIISALWQHPLPPAYASDTKKGPDREGSRSGP